MLHTSAAIGSRAPHFSCFLSPSHWQAGKGRTGLVCTCLLLREGLEMTASEALSTYADRRTHNHKGVTIPSQIRYVQYYEQCLRERRLRKWETVYLERVCLENIVSPGRCSRCSIQVQVLDVDRRLLSQSAWTALSESIEDEDSHSEAESSHLQEGLLVLELDGPELPADFHVILRARWEEFCGCGRAETVKLCSFWLNTGYVTEEMRLQMSELDFAKPTPPSFDDYSVICCFHCCNPMEVPLPQIASEVSSVTGKASPSLRNLSTAEVLSFGSRSPIV